MAALLIEIDPEGQEFNRPIFDLYWGDANFNMGFTTLFLPLDTTENPEGESSQKLSHPV